VLLVVAGILVFHRGKPVEEPPAAPPAAQAVAPETLPPVGESHKRVGSAGAGSKPAARQPAQNAGGAQPKSEPAAMAPLRRLFEQSEAKEAAPAAVEAPPVGRRPQALGPPPTVTQGAESGVLLWSGAAPAGGGQVVISDGTQLGGGLSGDALPGVPVRVSVIDNLDIAITEAPGPRNGNRRVVLQVPANVSRPIRINWQVQTGSRP
jgi:hypothetical protein